MRYISVVAILIASSDARVDPDIACKAICGLDHRVSARECEAAVANGTVCSHVYRERSGGIYFSLVPRADLEVVTVISAIAETVATENNCFAMCFDNMLCRPRGSYCTEAGVCAALFWNKQKARASDSYAFHLGGTGDVSNQDAPVTCDSDIPEQFPGGRVNATRVDPCIATCHLSIPSEDTCRWVEEANGRCNRLFWTSAGKTNVVFSPRTPRAPQMEINSSELFELLKAPGNDCEALCNSVSSCRLSGRGSFCRSNGACQGLFYQNGTQPVKADLVPCYGVDCHELTPVMCDPDSGLSGTTTVVPTVSVSSTTTGAASINSQPSARPLSGGINNNIVSEPTPTTSEFRSNERMSQPTAAMIVLAVIAVTFF